VLPFIVQPFNLNLASFPLPFYCPLQGDIWSVSGNVLPVSDWIILTSVPCISISLTFIIIPLTVYVNRMEPKFHCEFWGNKQWKLRLQARSTFEDPDGTPVRENGKNLVNRLRCLSVDKRPFGRRFFWGQSTIIH
jgi:hypothetical protein